MDKLIELHLHLDGSLRPETVWELAKEQNIKLPANTVDEVRDQMQVPEDCRTLEEYLTRFDLPLLVLQTREALERAAFELTEDWRRRGVTYAEIRFAPQLSIKGGMTQEQAVEAAIEGVKRGMEQYPSIRIGLILCCMRGEDNEEWNLQTVETAKKYLGDVVCAVDIAGAESLYPTERFAPVFEKVREYGLSLDDPRRRGGWAGEHENGAGLRSEADRPRRCGGGGSGAGAPPDRGADHAGGMRHQQLPDQDAI